MTSPASPTTPALNVRGMSVAYGPVVAVHDATFTIAEGESVAITGPNGNGKSSILMGIVGLAARRGASASTSGGGLFGVALYALNMYGFTAIFPWFAASRDGITLVAHIAFGVVAAGAYRVAARQRG